MSFESTSLYYERINRQINKRIGGFVSADLVLRSVNFEEYQNLLGKSWSLASTALNMEGIPLINDFNCDCVAVASNMMHRATDLLEKNIISRGKKFVHIGDCLGERCNEEKIRRVVLLGTKTTMTEDFLKKRLKRRGVEVVDNFTADTIGRINKIIFSELCHGERHLSSMMFLRELCQDIASLKTDGEKRAIDGVILGCTELNLLLGDSFIDWMDHFFNGFKILDSTQVHIDKLVELSLS